MDIGLFYSKDSKAKLVEYFDGGCHFNPHKVRSQTCIHVS